MVKIIPGILRPALVGVGTIAITYVLGITVLGPMGDVVGSYVVNIFLWSGEHLGPVAVGILAGCMPFLVMTGMHHAVTPFMVQAITNPGYDVLAIPIFQQTILAIIVAILVAAVETFVLGFDEKAVNH